MVEPGRWEGVQTDAGWHLRLVGANGEIVLTSEVYEDPREMQEAINIAHRTVEHYKAIEDQNQEPELAYTVDERTKA